MSPREIFTLSAYEGKKSVDQNDWVLMRIAYFWGVQRITIGSACCKCNLEKWHVSKQIMETLLMGFHSKLQRRHLSKELPWGTLPRIYFLSLLYFKHQSHPDPLFGGWRKTRLRKNLNDLLLLAFTFVYWS